MLLYVIISFLFGTIIPKIRRFFYNLLLVYLYFHNFYLLGRYLCVRMLIEDYYHKRKKDLHKAYKPWQASLYSCFLQILLTSTSSRSSYPLY